MHNDLPPVRRVVTENDENGKSFFVSDGSPTSIREVPERPGYRVNNIWRTSPSPALIRAEDDIHTHQGIMPPKNGTVLRIIDYPPDPQDPIELKKQLDAMFAHLYQDAGHDLKEGEHPGMHITETVDYAIVLFGQMTAILEKEETILNAGDVLIQRGTNHAWTNRSGQPARIAFILIDGTNAN
jgi:hypothetical protein